MPGPGGAGGGGVAGGSLASGDFVPVDFRDSHFLAITDEICSSIFNTFEYFFNILSTDLVDLLPDNVLGQFVSGALKSLGFGESSMIEFLIGTLLVTVLIFAIGKFFLRR